MELKIKKRLVLEGIPSASGIEYFNDHIYITADNSPWLFQLNCNFEQVSRFRIHSDEDLQNDTIPKPLKPDFEAMTIVPSGGDSRFLYVFGSGSKSPRRDLLVRIDVTNPGDHTIHPLTSFYSLVKSKGGYTDENFNIEAAAVVGDSIVLMNRATNDAIGFSIAAFNRYLEDGAGIDLHFTHFNLPSIKGLESKISGCASISNGERLLITSSVENTADWIADGEVLGSFIGVTSLRDLAAGTEPACIQIENVLSAPLKIESVVVVSSSARKARLLLVSDNDEGVSELLDAVLIF